MAEWLGSRAINQKVVSISSRADVVSLGKALHPTCLWENDPVQIGRASCRERV